jgi:hypothetical protein
MLKRPCTLHHPPSLSIYAHCLSSRSLLKRSPLSIHPSHSSYSRSSQLISLPTPTPYSLSPYSLPLLTHLAFFHSRGFLLGFSLVLLSSSLWSPSALGLGLGLGYYSPNYTPFAVHHSLCTTHNPSTLLCFVSNILIKAPPSMPASFHAPCSGL